MGCCDKLKKNPVIVLIIVLLLSGAFITLLFTLGLPRYYSLNNKINDLQNQITVAQTLITGLQTQIEPYASQYNADL